MAAMADDHKMIIILCPDCRIAEIQPHQKFCSKRCKDRFHQRNWYRNNKGVGRWRKHQIRVARPWVGPYYAARHRAKRDGVVFALTLEWCARYDGHCEVTGLPFQRQAGGIGPGPYSLTIDRREPGVGYTPENCRFVIYGYNAMKGSGTDDDCRTIALAMISRASFRPLPSKSEAPALLCPPQLAELPG